MTQPQHNKSEPIVPDRNFLPYPTRTLDPPFSIVDRAKEIEKAEEHIKIHVNGKLNVIVEQIRHLQEEARRIIEAAEQDMELHKIKCNFEKKAGLKIHLYQKETGRYFSLLSPEEWGTPPHTFLGTYTILADQSFEKINCDSEK